MLSRSQATVFDFGAVSIAYRWPMREQTSVDDLPRISHDLHALNLETHAREQVLALMQKIKPTIVRPQLAELVEDYYIFVLERLDQFFLAEELMSRHRESLAQTLRMERGTLSHLQQEEALSQRISYYETDLTLID